MAYPLDDVNLDEPLYPFPVAAKAANVELTAFRMYATKDRAPLSGELKVPTPEGEQVLRYCLGTTGGGGRSTLLTLRGVFTYALTAALIETGMSAAKAQATALVWTLVGDDEPQADSREYSRPACQLFGGSALTILITDYNRTYIVQGNVQEFTLTLRYPFRPDKICPTASVIIDPIHKQVMRFCKEYVDDSENWREKYGWRK